MRQLTAAAAAAAVIRCYMSRPSREPRHPCQLLERRRHPKQRTPRKGKSSSMASVLCVMCCVLCVVQPATDGPEPLKCHIYCSLCNRRCQVAINELSREVETAFSVAVAYKKNENHQLFKCKAVIIISRRTVEQKCISFNA